jgi:hypothetical protein
MRKEILAFTIFVASTLAGEALADTIHLGKGWNLKGASCETNVETFSQEGVKVVWAYRNGRWFAWSPIKRIRDLIKDLTTIGVLNVLLPYEGFWVYATEELDVPICHVESGEGEEGQVLDYPLKRVLEGKYDSVLSELSDSRKNDGEKIAYALALLEKRVEVDFLEKMGLKIIPQNYSFFRLDDDNAKRWCNAQEWVKGVENLIESINKAIEELDTVSENVKVKVPPFAVDGDEVYIDKTTVEFLKALLMLKRAELKYALSYNWSELESVCSNEDEHVLPYLEKLTVSKKEYIESARKEFESALKKLQEVAEDVQSLSEDKFKQNLIYWLFSDEDEITKEDVSGFEENTLKSIQNSLQEGGANIGNPVGTYSEYVNVKYLFDTPFDGKKLADDIRSGKVIEVSVCTYGMSYCYGDGNCEKMCFEKDSEIWFTQDSYLYEYIKKINSSAVFHERQLNGKTYYTLDENDDWNFVEPVKEYPSQ